MTAPRVLIAGAGPTGLAAALFLTLRGVPVRIIDAAEQPSSTSRALGVNPRTLSLLEGTGVTEAIRAEALPMRGLVPHQGGRELARVRLNTEELAARHPMMILPQARTEALLAEALAKLGVAVERGRKLVATAQTAETVTARLEDGQIIETSVLLGADGAHSAVRHLLDIGFPGEAMAQTWELADLALEGPEPGWGSAHFETDGILVALPFDATTWRLIGFGGDLLERLPKGWRAGAVSWRSEFRISHRVADRFALGRVCLAGDAAHIHSPIGARGMNLGIEDAFVFAHCAWAYLDGRADALEAYACERRKTDWAVVERIEGLTRAISATGGLAHALRPWLLGAAARIGPLRRAGLRAATGLDHEVVLP